MRIVQTEKIIYGANGGFIMIPSYYAIPEEGDSSIANYHEPVYAPCPRATWTLWCPHVGTRECEKCLIGKKCLVGRK